MRAEGKIKVLVVSSNDTFRGPVFSMFLQTAVDNAGLKVEVQSAGMQLLPGDPQDRIPTLAVQCLSRHGLAVKGHISRWIGNLPDLDQFKIILCCNQRIKESVEGLRLKTGTRVKLICEPEGIAQPENNPPSYRERIEQLNQAANSMAGNLVT